MEVVIDLKKCSLRKRMKLPDEELSKFIESKKEEWYLAMVSTGMNWEHDCFGGDYEHD